MKLQPFQISDGYSKFINLTDTPNEYAGDSAKALIVKDTEDGLEFGTASGGALTDGYLRLTEKDTDPSSLSDTGNVYSKKVDGYSELYYMDNYGLITQLTNKSRVFIPTNELYTYPTNPHPQDDEFESTTLGSVWAEDFTASGSIDYDADFAAGNCRRQIHTDYEKSWYSIQPPYDSASKHLHRYYSMPTNVFIWARVKFERRHDTSVGDDDQIIGMALTDTSAGAPRWNSFIKVWLNEQDAGQSNVEVNFQYNSLDKGTYEGITANQQEQGFDYIGVHKVGTVYYVWVFNNVGQGLCLWNYDMPAPNFSIDRIVFMFKSSSTLFPGNYIAGIDFIRFVESATFLPGMHK